MSAHGVDPSNPSLWSETETQLTRAERLLQRALNQLELDGDRRQRQFAGVAFEVERILAPLQAVNAGLGAVIEAMALERQDSLSQRWQGQLQELLIPMDGALLQIQELLLQLERPDDWRLNPSASGPAQQGGQRLQLQQLLAVRQRQVLQQQAELAELRRRLFAQAPPDQDKESSQDEAPPPSSVPTVPTIFDAEAP